MLLVRKMHLHLGPIALSTFLIVAGAIWQFTSGSPDSAVSGSTLAGLVVGSVAAGIILFELLLWPRKRLRRFKLGRTKHWLAYHLWLGLACGPLAFIHSGLRFGGSFSSFLMTLLLLVLASGLFGWVMQTVIPKWMLGNLPQETIASQLDDVSLLSALECRQMLTVALGAKPPNTGKLVVLEDHLDALKSGRSLPSANPLNVKHDHSRAEAIVVGAQQRRDPQRISFSKELSSDPTRGDSGTGNLTLGNLTPGDSQEIWKQYTRVIEPFLLRGIISDYSLNAKHSPIGSQHKARDWFSTLQESCSPAVGPVLRALQSSVEQRLEFDVQRVAQAWLHRWVAIHASISVMLGVLLVVHIIQSIRYM